MVISGVIIGIAFLIDKDAGAITFTIIVGFYIVTFIIGFIIAKIVEASRFAIDKFNEATAPSPTSNYSKPRPTSNYYQDNRQVHNHTHHHHHYYNNTPKETSQPKTIQSTKKIYINHCYACGTTVNSEYCSNCSICGWLKCPKCGSCGCGYTGPIKKSKKIKYKKHNKVRDEDKIPELDIYDEEVPF